MSLRTLLFVLAGIVLALGLLVVVGSMLFVKSQIALLFPGDVLLQTNRALLMLITEQAIGVLLAVVVFLLVMLVVLGNAIIRPLHALRDAIEAFALHGERAPLNELENAPKEFQDLAVGFDNLATRIEQGRKNDIEAARIKTDFISTAAHQLRTPLTGIRWALEALEKESLTENQLALVKSAVEKSRDLVGIVGTLLDISSIESGKYKYTFTSVDMQELVESVTKDFAELSVRRQVSLFFARSDERIPPARADHERIKWILNNLIENALNYTPPGGTVRVSTESGGGRVYVRVRDTGIGIPSKDAGNIFERFYRGSNAVERENKGNGLGLYIARTIATDHGGDLNFSANEQSPGTTFTLSLPLA